MIAATIVLLLVVVALGVLLVRTNARLEAVTQDLGGATRAREAADAARRTAEADAEAARKERDDALERASRAKRDAADVARRMKQEADARARAEAELAAAQAPASGGDSQAGALWQLALASVRRTWEVSVAPSPDLPSPLDGSEDELRDAVGIVVDAAREEAGAAIELEWTGPAVIAPGVAVQTLAVAQELIGRLAKATSSSVLRVTTSETSVAMEVAGSDVDGAPFPVDALLTGVAPDHQVVPGRFELA